MNEAEEGVGGLRTQSFNSYTRKHNLASADFLRCAEGEHNCKSLGLAINALLTL